tara:strand:+ start:462 stop:755 length:294 start_codon:yes stop_codon:yes gene_type:complete
MDIVGLLRRHPNRIPVMVQSKTCRFRKKKFLVPTDTTVVELIHTLRSYSNNLQCGDGLFLFVNNILPSQNTTVKELHMLHQIDLILHISIEKEDVFG